MPEGAQRVEGINKGHENGGTIAFVGVRLTDQLGGGVWHIIAVVACILGT